MRGNSPGSALSLRVREHIEQTTYRVHRLCAQQQERCIVLVAGAGAAIIHIIQGGDYLIRDELLVNHSKDWQLWRYEIKKGNPHAHFKTKAAMDKFLVLLDENKKPTKRHYIISAKRLLSDEEYDALQDDMFKDRYHNKVKQLRKQNKVFRYR